MNDLRVQITESHKQSLQPLIQETQKSLPKGFFKKPSEDDLRRTRTIIENAMKLYMMTSTNINFADWFHYMDIILQTLKIEAVSKISLELPELISTRRENSYKDLLQSQPTYSPITLYNINDSVNAIIENDWYRIITGIRSFLRSTQNINHSWKKVLKSLTNERGPWGNAKNSSSNVVKYCKLQNKLNEFSTRHKLKYSENGTDHHLASVFTDTENDKTVKRGRLNSTVELDNQLLKDIQNASKKEKVESPMHKTMQPEISSQTISFETELITPLLPVKGTIKISTAEFKFIRDPIYDTSLYSGEEVAGKKGVKKESLLKAPKNITIPLTNVISIENRRYQLRHVAFELFTMGRRALFFNMKTKAIRDQVINVLMKFNIPAMSQFRGNLPYEEILRQTDLVGRWCRREISNFEYLMEINRLAGRTYNDLGQYPIMPWVIKDYDSETLDLDNPETFRDFKRPMGAQLPERRSEIAEKYQLMKDEYIRMKSSRDNDMNDDLGIMTPPPRHYATHYSNPSSVLWYLVRLEPFTTGHIYLQDGSFDRTDRQFFSVKQAYISATTNDTDVKELIPEWFILPEFLKNNNKYYNIIYLELI